MIPRSHFLTFCLYLLIFSLVMVCIYVFVIAAAPRYKPQTAQYIKTGPNFQPKENYLLQVLDEFILETSAIAQMDRIDPKSAPVHCPRKTQVQWLNKLQAIWNLFKELEDETKTAEFMPIFRSKIRILNAISTGCLRFWVDRFNRMPKDYEQSMGWVEQVEKDEEWNKKHSISSVKDQ